MSKLQGAQMKMMQALVVENNLVNQQLISMQLKRVGFQVTFVETGVDVVKKLNEMKFNIIFLDVLMPILDGFQICKEIKSNEKISATPVIMLTRKNNIIDKLRSKLAGSDVYLTKPIKNVDFINVIAKFYPIKDGLLDLNMNKNSSDTIVIPKYFVNGEVANTRITRRRKQ